MFRMHRTGRVILAAITASIPLAGAAARGDDGCSGPIQLSWRITAEAPGVQRTAQTPWIDGNPACEAAGNRAGAALRAHANQLRVIVAEAQQPRRGELIVGERRTVLSFELQSLDPLDSTRKSAWVTPGYRYDAEADGTDVTVRVCWLRGGLEHCTYRQFTA